MGIFDRSPVFRSTDSVFIQALQLLTTVFMAAGGYYLIKRMNGYRLRPTPRMRLRQGGRPIEAED